MTATLWKEEYSVGDPIIDAQHQQLIATMNQLSELLTSGADRLDEASSIFAQLAVYVLDHFGYEEQRMAACAYPPAELAAHKATHAGLVRQVREFQKRVGNGDREALHDLLPFLTGTWLTEHICHTDRQYVPFLKSGRAD